MKIMQPMVEVPDHMASSSAFSDLLGSDSSHSRIQFAAVPCRVPPADETAKIPALPEHDVPLSWRPEAEPEPNVLVPRRRCCPCAKSRVTAVPVTVEDAAAPVSEPDVMSEPAPATESLSMDEAAIDDSPAVSARPIQIPVYQDPAPSSAEFMPTASAPIGDVDVPRESALQDVV